jgi:hypothetical protein
MKNFLLAVLLLQGNPQGVGIVTGVVHGAGGAPAVGVRVYAVAVRETPEASAATAPLEGLAQTDASGRYRLEVSPGRYYIASGSVSAPTYHPGTRDIQSARVVTVASGSVNEAIDFSSFVPASSLPMFGAPVGTGVLSGTLRFPDGTPAGGIAVSAALASVVSGAVPAAPSQISIPPAPATPFIFVSSLYRMSMTQNSGQYLIQGLSPGTYYIAAGTSESPTLYPGVTDQAVAKTIVTTPTTNLTSLDFTVPRPPSTTSISGRVTARGGASAAGASVGLRHAVASASPYGLPPSTPPRSITIGPDGKFEFVGVFPGTYTVDTSSAGVPTTSKAINVTDQPIRDLEISIAAVALSGSIIGENSGALEDPRIFVDAIVTTVSNPNMITSTIMPITKEGKFARIIEPEEYRFYLRTLPEEYTIRSVTAGGVDLLKETLKVTGDNSISIEVRVAKRTVPDSARVSVKGRALDSVSGNPSNAERLTLCCRESGASQRFSAPLGPDGSFEFTGLPPGRYDVGFQVKAGFPELFPVGEALEVGAQSVSELTVKTTPQFGQLAATIRMEDGGAVPSNSPMAVVFTSTKGLIRVVAQRGPNGSYLASLPIGDRYTLSVTDLPPGYAVKSTTGSTEVTPVNYPPIGTPPPPVPIVIIIGPALR